MFVVIESSRLHLETITPSLAARIVDGCRSASDLWHPEYPLEDELEPLRGLAVTQSPDEAFTLYMIRLRTDGLTIGGLGFFGPPDDHGRIEFGYGLVPSVRGRGLATEAVIAALGFAARHGARSASADTDVDNIASQRVLMKAGLIETSRSNGLVFFERDLTLQ